MGLRERRVQPGRGRAANLPSFSSSSTLKLSVNSTVGAGRVLARTDPIPLPSRPYHHSDDSAEAEPPPQVSTNLSVPEEAKPRAPHRATSPVSESWGFPTAPDPEEEKNSPFDVQWSNGSVVQTPRAQTADKRSSRRRTQRKPAMPRPPQSARSSQPKRGEIWVSHDGGHSLSRGGLTRDVSVKYSIQPFLKREGLEDFFTPLYNGAPCVLRFSERGAVYREMWP